jgi:hypothetical protein
MRRQVATTLLTAALAVVAPLAGAGTASACSLPLPFDGEIRGFRLVGGPGGVPLVSWRAFDRDGPEDAGAAVLKGETWAWADAAGVPDPGTPGLPGGAVVSEAAGDAVAVWQQNQTIVAASRDGATAFGLGLILEDDATPPPGGFWMAPTVSLGADGHAVALWTRQIVETPSGPELGAPTDRRVVRAADRTPDGTWSAPYDLAPPGAARGALFSSCGPIPSQPSAVAIDAAGNAVAVWETWLPAPGDTVTMWSSRPAGGAWAAPTVLTTGHAYSVQLAIDAAGTAHAAWIEDQTARSARRPADGDFSPAEVLGPARGTRIALEVDAAGRSIAVWQSSALVVSAATRPADGSWNPPVDLTALEKPTGPTGPGIVDSVPELPVLHAVRLSRAAIRRPIPTVLSFRLRTAGEVRVTVQRRGRGKAVRGLRLTVGAGQHRIRLFATRPLPPGRYTVKIRVSVEGRVPEVRAKQLVVRPA